jgi:hypothetical protein
MTATTYRIVSPNSDLARLALTHIYNLNAAILLCCIVVHICLYKRSFLFSCVAHSDIIILNFLLNQKTIHRLLKILSATLFALRHVGIDKNLLIDMNDLGLIFDQIADYLDGHVELPFEIIIKLIDYTKISDFLILLNRALKLFMSVSCSANSVFYLISCPTAIERLL